MDGRENPAPLPESLEGVTSLFSWMVTLNYPYLLPQLRSIDLPCNGDEVPADQKAYVEVLSHETTHFIQALSASYIYTLACLLLQEVEDVIQYLRRLPPDAAIELPLENDGEMLDILAGMRVKSTILKTPDVPGVSAVDLIEGSALFLTMRAVLTGLTPQGYLARLDAQYADGALRVYSDAYRLADWFLGEDAFHVFPIICYLSLCSNEPGETFLKYVRAIGKSGGITDPSTLTACGLAELGKQHGVTEMVTAPQAVEHAGWHPVLLPYIVSLCDKLQDGVSLIEFAAQPDKCDDLDILELAVPPLTHHRDDTGMIPPNLPDFLSYHSPDGKTFSWEDNADYIIELTSICGAAIAMVMPAEYYMRCPHTDCPYYMLRLCHAYVRVPKHHSECGFPARFASTVGHEIGAVRMRP